MQWTIGIVTNGQNDHFLKTVIESINVQSPSDNYEILVVGNTTLSFPNTEVIPFDEFQKEGWITRKKNIIAQRAKYPNICLTHDYFYFHNHWFAGYEKFGEDWEVAMNVILNVDGSRFRDWVYWDNHYKDSILFVDYDDHSKVNKMFISGGYFCVKKDYLLEHPLNENLCWGQGEDGDWTHRRRAEWKYRMNKFSTVQALKYKHANVMGNI